MQTSLLYRNKENIKKEKLIFSDHFYKMAFDNSLQANLVFFIPDGSIYRANKAACKLLGYTKKELVTKKMADIFNITPGHFKKTLIQRISKVEPKVLVRARRNSGEAFPCEITSVFFIDEDGGEKAITTLADVSQSLQKHKKLSAIKADTMLANDTTKLIKELEKKRETERLNIEIELSDNVSQLLCASLLYNNMAQRGEENMEQCLNRSSQYTLAAIEKIKKIIKELTTGTKEFRALVVT